jgi:Zn finger protein HypA/HybF involved in hydrogenase expression
MGRKKEFKVQKAFTIGAKEIMWAQEKCQITHKGKLSPFIDALVHKAMVEDLNQIQRKPSTWCTSCNAYRGFDNVKGKWLCEECNDDKTEVIKYSLR